MKKDSKKYGFYGRASTIESARATLKNEEERIEYDKDVKKVLEIAKTFK